MIQIRYYNDSDYKDVKSILQEGKLFDKTWESRKNLSRKIAKDPESILIAANDGKIVGCVFIVEDGWNGFIWRLCVKENQRKQGIGLMLMEKAEKIIKKRGISEASLFVDPDNASLKEWYEKQKYKKGRNWTFMYKPLNDRK